MTGLYLSSHSSIRDFRSYLSPSDSRHSSMKSAGEFQNRLRLDIIFVTFHDLNVCISRKSEVMQAQYKKVLAYLNY